MAVPIETFLSPNLTNMLITFVIPFLIIFTVFLVTLRMTKIFTGSIAAVISLGLTIMIYAVNPGNVFQFLASYLFQIGVMGSVIALTMVLFVFLWTFVKGGIKVAEKLKGPEQQLKDLRKEEEKLLKKFYGSGVFGGANIGKRIQIQNRLDAIEKHKRFLLAKMKRLEQ